MGEAVEFFGYPSIEYFKTTDLIMEQNHEIEDECWFEEEIDIDLKWSFALNR